MNQRKNNMTEEKKGKILRGVVVSNKMKDTVIIAVTRFVKHPKYQKYSKRVKRHFAHAPQNTLEIGEKVEIKETKPISKNKSFVVVTNDKKS